MITRTPDIPVPAHEFLPADFEPSEPGRLAAVVDALLARPIESPDELRRFVYDWSEVASKVSGEWARRKTTVDRDTRKAAAQAAARSYRREVLPAWDKHEDRLARRYLDSPHRAGLGDEFAVFDRNRQETAALFREENTDLLAEDRGLAAEWQEIQGATLIRWGDEELTPSRATLLLLDRDRAVREHAHATILARRAEDRERIDGIFDELVRLRTRMARNAGYDNYRDYRFAQLHRHDYDPGACEAFHAAVAAVALPAARELYRARQVRLGVERLRPSDLEASLFPTDEPRLFRTEEELVALARRFFGRIDRSFLDDFDVLVRNGMLDLMSRTGKAPGAYNWGIADIRVPFIFGNAVGRSTDLRTLLHEGGHAFHSLACREQPILDYRGAPAEFAEVASMSMEMFGLERMPELLGEATARALQFEQFQKILHLFSAVATIDSFQHWVYTNPDHGRDERRERWAELSERFLPPLDWGALEPYRGDGWQRIPHLFSSPFYYIEYGIAQLGALQMWRNEQADHDAAVAAYRSALALGGSRPLPELFAAAGLRFTLDESIFRELIPAVVARIEACLGDAAG